MAAKASHMDLAEYIRVQDLGKEVQALEREVQDMGKEAQVLGKDHLAVVWGKELLEEVCHPRAAAGPTPHLSEREGIPMTIRLQATARKAEALEQIFLCIAHDCAIS